jgi:Putative Flp pilus-assembly TadE/G-like
MLNRHRNESGSVLVLVAISLVALLGIAALAIDVGNFRAHRRQLQTAADAGALAGAAQLIQNPSNVCGSGSQSDYFERRNTNLTDPKNLVQNTNLDTSFCDVPAGTLSVRVWPSESNVPWWFGRVLGFTSSTVSARARARVVYLKTARGLLPIGVEDLMPQSVTMIVDSTGQRIPLGGSGCSPQQTVEGFPYWCGNGSVNDPITAGSPATWSGSTVSVEVVDTSGKTITFLGVGWVGGPKVVPCSQAGATCTIKDVSLPTPAALANTTSVYPYDEPPNGPIAFGVKAHVVGVPATATSVTIASGGGNSGVVLKLPAAYPGGCTTASPCLISSKGQTVGSIACLSGTTDCVFSTSQAAFSGPSNQGPQPVTLAVNYGQSGQPTSYQVQQVYGHDSGDLLQQLSETTVQPGYFVDSSNRSASFSVAFTTLVPGRQITLKLGGGGALGPGNFGVLDLDTTTTWPQYACYTKNGAGAPNLQDEIQHGSCTPYSLGDLVATQTGNQADIDNGLDGRIHGSPNNWTTTANPPPSGDPRWVDLVLVAPLSISDLNGNGSVPVVGFGNFYITDYHSKKYANSGLLKPGEVSGVFWVRDNPTGPYNTSCVDASGNPSNICLEAVALMPWDG